MPQQIDGAFLVADVAPYTKSGPERIAAMVDALRRIDREGIIGDVVECGVWRGGNIILARKLCPNRICWLYDTFDGMTAPTPDDVTRSGRKASDSYNKKLSRGAKWADVSLGDVRANLEKTGMLDDNRLRFIVGPVEDTLRDATNIPERIALLRLDTDWHESTKVELEVLYPQLVPGGILIVDDYGHWMGARKAVDEYFGDAMPVMVQIDYTAVMCVKSC